jgi:anti-sigma-K factor RskA
MTVHGPDHARWEDAAAPYLLGALDESDQKGFEAHVRDCPACAEEIEELRMAADALPAAPQQLEVPPEVKARVMAIVEAEAATLQAARPAVAEPPPRTVRPRPRRSWSWLPRPALAGALAALLLLAGGLGGTLLAGGGAGEARTVVAEVDQAAAPNGQARLEVASDGSGRLVGTDLPSPGSGRVHQVWLMRRGESAPRPTDALFLPRNGAASVAVPGDLDDVEAVLVSAEPVTGSDAPTTAPWLTVRTS